MNYTELNKFCRKKSFLLYSIITILVLSCLAPAGVLGESAREVFNGREDASFVIENLRYTDIKGTGAEAEILKAGAMGILKGYGSRLFSPVAYLTKEEALALVYRMAGREEEAQLEGQRLNMLRRAGDRKTAPQDVWSDGFLQLAANDGLITNQDLQDALKPDQGTLDTDSFRRDAPVLRQEFASWLARVLQLEPVYVQEAIFNSFNDWRSAAPENIPWIEAVLRKGIMSNDGNGYFRPNGFVDRKTAAVILNNALDDIMALRGMRREFGRVEDITTAEKAEAGKRITEKIYHIRNSDGSLHNLVVDNKRGIVIIKDGIAGNSEALAFGDRIEYIAGYSDETGGWSVVCAEVISSVNDTEYVAVKLMEMDTQLRIAKVKQYFRLDFPHIRPGDDISFNMAPSESNAVYRYKEGIAGDIKPGDMLILTIQNGIITEMQRVEFPFTPAPENVIGGIVEENNPSLGYITLYNEDGTGISPEHVEEMVLFRTFNYPPGKRVEAFRNHKTVSPDEISEGDTVFIRLDSEGYIESMSAAENYITRRGRILSRAGNRITVQYENKTEQILEISGNTVVIIDGKIADSRLLEEGDHAEFLLNVTAGGTTVRRISVNNGNKLITGLYKAVLADVDLFTQSIKIYNVEKLQGNRWDRIEHKGVTEVKLSEDCSFYADGLKLSRDEISPRYRGDRLYMAVRSGYGNEEVVETVLLTSSDTETVFSDEILSASDSGVIRLSAERLSLYCSLGAIIVSNGRLVGPGYISKGDMACLVANRDPFTGRYNAVLVSVIDNTGIGNLEIYRGRIAKIEENSSFTLSSFSRLEEKGWVYSNTPRTFNILHSTRIVNEEGVANIRDFKGYGEDSSIGRTIYVVADGINARLLSNVSYGSFLTRGTIRGIEGDTIYLGDVRNYNPGKLIWEETEDIQVRPAPNTIIIKNGDIVTAGDLARGDTITILRKDGGSEEAYVVITGSGIW